MPERTLTQRPLPNPTLTGSFPPETATDDAGDTGDLETAEGPDAEADAAADEPGAADAANDGGEQPAPAETEATDELKVVLSIRGGRAIIGVQRPSADPHIESFDDTDLFGLADEFPAVVARAQGPVGGGTQVSRLRETHSPTPAAEPPPAGNGPGRDRTEGETEAEQQPQPETLRLF